MNEQKAYLKTDLISLDMVEVIAPLDFNTYMQENEKVDRTTNQVVEETKNDRFPSRL